MPLLFLSFTLGHILRSEDTDSPYILSDGSLYRDIATVETAKKAEMVTLHFQKNRKSCLFIFMIYLLHEISALGECARNSLFDFC